MSIYLERGPRTDDELWWLVRSLWGHTVPRTSVCPGHDAPFDAFATAYFNREPQILIRGSRGLAGKSRLISLLGLTYAAVRGADVNILGGSLNQSNNIHQTIRDALEYKNAPTYLIKDQSMTMIRLTNGAKLQPLTASQKTVRGPHPPFLLLDEIDEMDPEILESAKGQPMPQKNYLGEMVPAQTVMASTLQYADKAMMQEMKRFEEENLPIYNWCISHGEMVTTKRGQVPIEQVATDDQVLTRQGWRPVQHVTYTGVKSTVRVRFSNGSQVVCTPDHEIATVDGFRKAASLVAGSLAFASTGAAETEAGLGVPVHVAGLGHVVSVRAGARTLGVRPSPALVLAGGDHLHVPGVDTSSVSTQVVEMHPGRDLTVDLSPDPAVRVGASAPTVDDLVLHPVTVAHEPGPRDTLVSIQSERVDGERVVTRLPGDLLAAGATAGSVPLGGDATIVAPVTVVAVDHGLDLPVYDLGVYDVHEFFVDSIVVKNCHMESANPVDGWLSPDFIIQKKREVSAERWRVEYELGEPSIGNRAFDSDAVERMFDIKPQPEHKIKVAKDYEQYKFADYRMDRDYVIAADWAKAQDFTVITVWDVTDLPIRNVYYLRLRRRPYPVMIGYYNDLMRTYHAAGIHDATGLGGVVADLLDSRVRGFLMTGAQRDNMLSEYVSAVENDKIRAPRIDSHYKATLFCSVEDMFSRGKEFHLPDEVCSAALAWKLVSGRAMAVEPVAVPNAADPNWFANQIAHNTQKHPNSEWEIGTVTRTTADPYEYNLMV